jgi:hypothetical protein
VCVRASVPSLSWQTISLFQPETETTRQKGGGHVLSRAFSSAHLGGSVRIDRNRARGGGGGGVDVDRERLGGELPRQTDFVLSFSYVCPEPVLVK